MSNQKNSELLHFYDIFKAIELDWPRISKIKNKIVEIEIHNDNKPSEALGNLLYFKITHEQSFSKDEIINTTYFTYNKHSGYYWVNNFIEDLSGLFLRNALNYYITDNNLIVGELPQEKEYDRQRDELPQTIDGLYIFNTGLEHYFFKNMLHFVEEYCYGHEIDKGSENAYIEKTLHDIHVIFYY